MFARLPEPGTGDLVVVPGDEFHTAEPRQDVETVPAGPPDDIVGGPPVVAAAFPFDPPPGE